MVDKIKKILEEKTDGVDVTEKKARSFSECRECSERVNNGSFQLMLHPGGSDEATIIMTYATLHAMAAHGSYPSGREATDANLGELIAENEKKSPGLQLSRSELDSSIKRYSLEELDGKLSAIL